MGNLERICTLERLCEDLLSRVIALEGALLSGVGMSDDRETVVTNDVVIPPPKVTKRCGDSVSEKCTAILNWASEKRPEFDTTTVESILDWVNEHEASANQERAIDNIIAGFHIDVGEWA